MEEYVVRREVELNEYVMLGDLAGQTISVVGDGGVGCLSQIQMDIPSGMMSTHPAREFEAESESRSWCRRGKCELACFLGSRRRLMFGGGGKILSSIPFSKISSP